MIEVNDGNRQDGINRRKLLIYAVLFCIGLTVFEFFFLPRKAELIVLTKHLENSNYSRLFVVLLLSFIAFILELFFFYAAIASSFRYRIVYFLLFSFAILTEYGYYKAYGRFSVFQDFEIVFFYTNRQILSNAAGMYFNYLAVFPIVIFGLLLTFTEHFWKKGLTAFIGIFLLSGSFFFVTGYFTKNTFYTNSFETNFRTFVSFPTEWYIGSYSEPPRIQNYLASRQKIDFHSATAPENNIVFIVDESLRGDHLSLNGYDKPTTPMLDELNRKNYVKNWGIAVSGTTCSGTSNNLMLTGLTDLPDHDYQVYKMPTVFQYAKAMNYKTYYFDGQVSDIWNGKPSDIPDFGEWIKESELSKNVSNKYDIDGEIARRIKEITENSTGNFIWVNKYGVHKPYTDSYPVPEDNTPSDKYKFIYNPEILKEELKNQYDRAIIYNSQSFFSGLFSNGVTKNTFYIYTSDHGQTLSEHGETISHCSNTKNEALVPLFIISEPAELPTVDTNYKASHSNIFATILDLMNFPENERKYNYSPSLLKAKSADSRPRHYYAGDLQGKDAGQKYPFD
jgi:glucan phosphoethanolaminetransferase (alkaline phosphatase superfamily)